MKHLSATFRVAMTIFAGALVVPVTFAMAESGEAAKRDYTPAPKVVAVSPINGTELRQPVTEVGVIFADDTLFDSLTVEAPDGTLQVLFEKGDEPFIGRIFQFALRDAAALPGVYAVHYVAWSLDHKSSTAGVFTFTIVGDDISELSSPSTVTEGPQ